jgi:hypothetical protein
MTKNIAGVARAAMLVDLNISTYSGRKQDKATQHEVTTSKGAGSRQAASVYKNLFANCAELIAITKFQARVRAEHYRLTLPWSDNGSRLLPTAALLDYAATMGKYQTEFEKLVAAFVTKYDTLVAAAAFQLGTLFDRSEYPTSDIVARRFYMGISYAPLPASGDFRLDIESEVQADLIKQYEERARTLLARANQDAWTRLHTVLSKLSDRLVVDADGKKNVFHDTIITNAEELCDLLRPLNVTGDADLERARRRLQDALEGVTPQALREELSTRLDVKRQVDVMLESYDWGITPDEA